MFNKSHILVLRVDVIAWSDALSCDGIKITEWLGASLGAEPRCILARLEACTDAGCADTEARMIADVCVQRDEIRGEGKIQDDEFSFFDLKLAPFALGRHDCTTTSSCISH